MDQQLYPNILKLVTIGLVMPFTSTEAERSFSSLRDLITAKRSTMTATRLSALAVIHCNYKESKELDVRTVFKEFKEKRSRRQFVERTQL